MLKTIRNASKGLLFALGSIILALPVLGYCSKQMIDWTASDWEAYYDPMIETRWPHEIAGQDIHAWVNQDAYEIAKNYMCDEQIRIQNEPTTPDPVEVARHTWMMKSNDKSMWMSAINGDYAQAQLMAITRSDGTLADMAVFYFVEIFSQYKKGNTDLMLRMMKDWEDCVSKYPSPSR